MCQLATFHLKIIAGCNDKLLIHEITTNIFTTQIERLRQFHPLFITLSAANFPVRIDMGTPAGL